MPLTTTFTMDLLLPAFPGQESNLPTIPVKLVASTTYPKGCLLGEVTATPGTFGPYASGASDGTQNAKLLLQRACVTDASGNITYGTATGGMEWGQTYSTAPAYYDGVFRTADLPQSSTGAIDATAVDKTSAKHIGCLIQGTTAAGLLKIGN